LTPANRPAQSETLSAMESLNDVVLLVTSPADPAWTSMAVANCDRVVLVEQSGADPLPEPDISAICGPGQRPTVDLAVMHMTRVEHPRLPPRWAGRPDIDAHLHIRAGERADSD